jgi:hypothetical protein
MRMRKARGQKEGEAKEKTRESCRVAASLCAEHVRQLGDASPLSNLMAVKEE